MHAPWGTVISAASSSEFGDGRLRARRQRTEDRPVIRDCLTGEGQSFVPGRDRTVTTCPTVTSRVSPFVNKCAGTRAGVAVVSVPRGAEARRLSRLVIPTTSWPMEAGAS